MVTQTFEKRNRGEKILATSARAALLAALVMLGSLSSSREAAAGAGAAAAAAAADGAAGGGLAVCATNNGKALYDCVANVVDKLGGQLSSANMGSTRSALQTAASQLRAATNKAQALSAISQCRALISGALRQVRALGGKYVEGWGGGGGGGSGLQAIVGVLSHAARLIQSKG
ncbi:MAG: hypothetical protein Q7U29_05450 [Bradyrhizobium sp.]|nr:hypothetical protein [Bradyrhizobium sp.]